MARVYMLMANLHGAQRAANYTYSNINGAGLSKILSAERSAYIAHKNP